MKVADRSSRTHESQLIANLRSGDNSAIEEFYNTYRDRIHSLVLQHMDNNQDMAEDIVGETFLAALNSLDKFRGDSQLYTWLCSIALHKISDFYRRQAREPRAEELPLGIDAIDTRQNGDTEPMAVSTIEAEETRHAVQQALVELPQNYRRVLVLKYIDDMPVQKISQVMGRSPKSIEGLLSRARKAMRSNLLDATISK